MTERIRFLVCCAVTGRVVAEFIDRHEAGFDAYRRTMSGHPATLRELRELYISGARSFADEVAA